MEERISKLKDISEPENEIIQLPRVWFRDINSYKYEKKFQNYKG